MADLTQRHGFLITNEKFCLGFEGVLVILEQATPTRQQRPVCEILCRLPPSLQPLHELKQRYLSNGGASERVQLGTIHGRVAGTRVLNTEPLNKSAVTLNRVGEVSSKVFRPPADGTVINSSMKRTY